MVRCEAKLGRLQRAYASHKDSEMDSEGREAVEDLNRLTPINIYGWTWVLSLDGS